jgi:hypothetical protein
MTSIFDDFAVSFDLNVILPCFFDPSRRSNSRIEFDIGHEIVLLSEALEVLPNFGSICIKG